METVISKAAIAATSESEDSEQESNKEEESDKEEEESDSDSGKGSEDAIPSCRRSLRFQPPTCHSFMCSLPMNYFQVTVRQVRNVRTHNLSSVSRVPTHTSPPSVSPHSSAPLTSVALASRRAGDHAHVPNAGWFALSYGHVMVDSCHSSHQPSQPKDSVFLAYGLGSKYKILQKFHKEMLSNSHVVVVNGFFPSINIKEIVDMIARDLLGLTYVLPSAHATVDWIESRRWTPRVFLLVHNLDAEMLRCDKTQRVLSRLASLQRVHLVASVDHINCPLLWDQGKLSGYNFMWEDVTTLLPYVEETSYETSLMAQNSGTLALSSLLSVYRSLPHNSRGVFRIILEKHLDANSQKYTGMAFSELYGRCREEMLVTSDLALRTMLTEFLDHQMVKWRRDEHLYIPTDLSVLRQFHSQIQDS
ncbi:origin recognition complex subunit 2-like [Homalodisca vitripennis]|uniref:origin recognition complex subunit 2-like n=1 Tax=Homalodisca vitripennis TaxID=197043 RepID=UPI001EEC78AF|nr:origin recognition complex subunit 2-like [Homalodisca vitripennis]